MRVMGWMAWAAVVLVMRTAAEPQPSGWPLTEEERAYVLKPEHERRPGREANQHKPELWPVVPSAGFWGGTVPHDLKLTAGTKSVSMTRVHPNTVVVPCGPSGPRIHMQVPFAGAAEHQQTAGGRDQG